MDDIQFYDTPTPRESGRKSKRLIYIVIFLLLLAGVALGASKFFLTQKKAAPVVVTPTPTSYTFPTDTPAASGSATPSPKTSGTPTPTSTTTSGLDRSSLAVEVENGSGTPGVASKMAATFKNLGYGVAGSKNADAYTYEGVTIKVKATKTKFAAQLKKDLSATYTITASTSDLPASSSPDAVVIVGK